MNDFFQASSEFYPIIYADDSTLFTSLDSFLPDTDTLINMELSKINDWLLSNRLCLNIPKTKAMLFHMPQKKINPPKIMLSGTEVEFVKCFDLLGIVLDPALNWKPHLNKISNKISKTAGILARLKRFLPKPILRTIYCSLVLPHLTYGVILWGPKSDKIFKLQKKVIRIISNSKYNAHTEPLFLQMNLLKVDDIKRISELKFAFRLLNSQLPQYFLQDFLVKKPPGRYRTRCNLEYVVPRVKHEYAKQNSRYRIAKLLNETPNNFISKINTHSLQGFSSYIKTHIIKDYKSECCIQNCYICSG